MPYCSKCGAQVSAEDMFCSKCGQPINKESSRTTIYEGEIHKCPNCGEVLDAFSVVCPACGYEIRGKKVSVSVRDFANKLTSAKTDAIKVDLIRSFPIPNTKEDVFEFMILASTNYDESLSQSGNAQKEIRGAWISKIEQGYQKAKLLFGDSSEFQKIETIYLKTQDKKKKTSSIKLILRTIGLWGGLLIFLIALILDVTTHGNTSMLHVGAGIIMIVGAFMIGRESKNLLEVGIGIACGIISMLLGLVLQEGFHGNGSMMEIAGGLVIVISIIRLVQITKNK